MFRLAILVGLVGVALAGKSPNADIIERMVRSHPGARYSNDILEDAQLDVPDLVAKYGYPVESHNVETQDGYGLTMHRIPHGRDSHNKSDPNKPIVFLMHGLLSSSADYLLLGPGRALGYILADLGYDVWLGNARGNYYSRRHRRLNPDSRLNKNFWKFSWDEIGNYDLPAFLDYIEAHTGQSRLHFVGHSQGGTSFLVLASLRPEYNKRFISFQGLAPASFFTHNEHPTFTRIAPLESILESAAFAMGRAEVFGSREFITWFALRYCAEESIFSPICTSIIVSGTSDHFNTTMIPVFLGHAPAGASIRQYAHFAQCINTDSFRRYDHGTLTNLRVYGRRTPPEYDLNKVTAPTYIYYATNDKTVHYQDVRLLASKLPNVKGAFQINSPTFDHLDFLWGSGAKDLFYTKMIRLMREAENAL
ncbi:hypothetical protein ABMA27_014430 [Loxostege sticticalis]|uniref:Lipase n=1 Tax=Loxostege sticticalis TaxID=481309 RepID=A0ABR3I8W1_LOXSC